MEPNTNYPSEANYAAPTSPDDAWQSFSSAPESESAEQAEYTIDDILANLDQVAKANPDFSVPDFLSYASDVDPVAVCDNADKFLGLGYDFPITEIFSKLRAYATYDIKVSSQDFQDWQDNYLAQFEDIATDLLASYARHNKLTPHEKREIHDSLQRFCHAASPSYRQKGINYTPPSPEAQASFEHKFEVYRSAFADLSAKYPSCTLDDYFKSWDFDPEDYADAGLPSDLPDFEHDLEALAADTFAGLTPEEISCERAERARRLKVAHQLIHFYEGVTSQKSDLLTLIEDADQGFYDSDEFLEYTEWEENQDRIQALSALECMDADDLARLRQMRLDYERTGIFPKYIDQNASEPFPVEDYRYTSQLLNLWKYDAGWENSEQGQAATGIVAEKRRDQAAEQWAELITLYPQVFENIDLDAADQLVEQFISEIPKDRVVEIAQLKNSGHYREADQAEVDLLAEVLHLSERPHITYVERSVDYAGKVTDDSYDIKIMRLFGGRDDESGIANTIAHEALHLYQREESDKGTAMGQLYAINYQHYQPAGDADTDPKAYERYRNQILEYYAFAFGAAFEEYYNSIVSEL